MIVAYLLDTNIVSYFLRESHPHLNTRLYSIPPRQLGISAVTEGELRLWAEKNPGSLRIRSLVEGFLASFSSTPWDSRASLAYAVLRARQERIGRPLSTEDLMIAAHALALGCVLITRDQALHQIDGLRTEDWTLPHE